MVGLVNGDTKASALTADPTLDTAAVKSSNAGSYPITLTGGTSANYSLTRSNATLTVGKAALELNADDKSKTYGEDNPSLSFSVVGLVNGDTKASALTADPTLDTAAVKSSNAGSYPITLTGGTSANYSLTRSNATLTVGKAALELNADDKSKTYGEDNPSLSFSVVGLVNGDTKASALTADPTLDTAAVKSSNAGSYPITLTGGTSANYSLTRSNATLTVGKAALELNADDKSKTYGEDNPSLSFSVVGLVNGDTKASALTADPTLDTAAVKSSNAGSYPITLTGGTSANYSLTRSNATLTVGKAALELNADDKSKTYGEDNPSLSFSVVGLVNGDTKASALTADPTLDTAAVKSSNAGSYPITLTGGTSANYSLTRSNATLTVGKAALELNADDKSKTYGEDNPSLSFSVVGLVNGDTKASALTADPTLDTAAVKSSNAGTYPITLTGGTSANYSLTRSNATLTVGKAALELNADDKSKTYGEDNPSLSFSVVGLVNGDTKASALTADPTLDTAAVKSSNAGTYPITLTGGTSANYSLTRSNATLTVGKAALELNADDKSKTYGEDNPSLSFSVVGLVNGDTKASALTADPTLDTAAVKSSNAGSYPITLTGGTSANYSLTRSNATLTVGKAALELNADDKSKTYGEDNPSLSFSVVGLVNGDTKASALTADPTLDTAAVKSSNAGTYPITLTGGTSANYSLTRSNATLTVGKAALELNADDKSKTYGEDNPSLSFSVVGLVNGDTKASALTADPTLDTAAVKSSNAGSYPITLTGGTSANYSLTRSNATLTVGKAALELNADDKSKTYGEDNPSLSFSVVGLVNGDTKASALTADPTLDTAAVKSSNAGTYPITLTGGTSANYSLTRSNATLTVGKAALELNADDKSKTYGEDNPSLSFSVVGLVNGDTKASALTADPTLDTAAVKSSNAGTYPITLTGGTSANYSLTRSNATLTVGKAAMVITAADKSKVYGDANPTLTGTITGLQNGDAITASYSTVATLTSGVGGYAIVPAAVDSSPSKLANYDVHLVNGSLSVTKRDLVISADNKSKVLGAVNPTFTGSMSGVQNGDAITASYSTVATATSGGGQLPDRASGQRLDGRPGQLHRQAGERDAVDQLRVGRVPPADQRHRAPGRGDGEQVQARPDDSGEVRPQERGRPGRHPDRQPDLHEDGIPGEL